MPATGLLSVLIPTFETAAGASLIAGLLTRAVVLLLSALTLTTGPWNKLSVWHTGILGPNGAGRAEVDFLCLVVCLMLFPAGPGVPAADSALGLERASQDRGQLGDKALVGTSRE
ncbi:MULTISPECIES: hypothetical protein [Streptomyces]|uniref:hypothetical protein n=1 Tax=Streptomyces TaxID=1883 RepID=UPI002B26A617|nr:hypothetical protein [Streptomyces scabiei]